MKKTTEIKVNDMGKLRIYLIQSEKAASESILKRIRSKPLFREIIKAAKEDKIMNASAFTTHYGYSNHNEITTAFSEGINHNTTVCIELIDQKEKLETFCKKHGKILTGKTIVYKPVEFWHISLNPDTKGDH